MIPTSVTLHQVSKSLSLQFGEHETYELSCEFLRVFTPSAEARGHAPGQEVLQVGKRDVSIERIEPVGQYALRLVFSDGHDTGLYSWDMLHDFCIHRDVLWKTYLDNLERIGGSRDVDLFASSSSGAVGCASGACSK
jgi:DUF971 family protein